MDTRAKKGTKLNEEELEVLRQALAKQEERRYLQNQGAILDRECAGIEKERELEKTRLQAERDIFSRDHDAERTWL